MSDSIYEYVMTELEACRGRWPDVARASGISHRTLEKIARREIQDPGVSRIEKLAEYFRTTAARQKTQRRGAA